MLNMAGTNRASAPVQIEAGIEARLWDICGVVLIASDYGGWLGGLAFTGSRIN